MCFDIDLLSIGEYAETKKYRSSPFKKGGFQYFSAFLRPHGSHTCCHREGITMALKKRPIAICCLCAICLAAIAMPVLAAGKTSTANFWATSATTGPWTGDQSTKANGYVLTGPRNGPVYGQLQYDSGYVAATALADDVTGGEDTTYFSGRCNRSALWRAAGYVRYSGDAGVCSLTIAS